MPYTKLFSSIVTSTIWVESDRTRIVWITMLALADRHGEVQASVPGLARIAGVPVADTETAINLFLAPDPYSRTPDDQGRRIEKIEGGWALINHAKYRDMASREESKEANAKRQKRHRDKASRNVTDSNATVTPSNASVTDTLHIAEAEAEADTKIIHTEGLEATPPPVSIRKNFTPPTPEQVEAYSCEIGYPLNGQGWCDSYAQKGWMVGKSKMKDWKAAVRNWKTSGYKIGPQTYAPRSEPVRVQT